MTTMLLPNGKVQYETGTFLKIENACSDEAMALAASKIAEEGFSGKEVCLKTINGRMIEISPREKMESILKKIQNA